MDDWLWFAGEVSLDFVNTVRDRFGPRRETLVGAPALGRWLQRTGLGDVGAISAVDFARALHLRAAIERLLEDSDDIEVDDIALLNRAVAGGRAQPAQLHFDPEGHLRLYPPVPTVASALNMIARNAFDVFGRNKPQRIKVCAHERCGLAFYDTSRAGSRRWCSMERCGNRAKVAKHAAAAKAR